MLEVVLVVLVQQRLRAPSGAETCWLMFSSSLRLDQNCRSTIKARAEQAWCWCRVDVDDCCNAAKHLAKEGKVDPKRLCITGVYPAC